MSLNKRELKYLYQKFKRRQRLLDKAWLYAVNHGDGKPIEEYPFETYQQLAKVHELGGPVEFLALVPRKNHPGYKVFMSSSCPWSMVEIVIEDPCI